jgi:hypothetical protein
LVTRHSLSLFAVLCLGCNSAAEVADETPPPAVSIDFARLPEILTGVQKTGSVVVYAGLPSQFWEPQLRNQELLQKETLDVHGHPVYDDPQTPATADSEQLTSLLSAKGSYQPLSSGKGNKCGGFTAEYCVEWTSGDTATQILICLECGEAMLFGPQSELYCNFSPEIAQRLKQLLAPYQKETP